MCAFDLRENALGIEIHAANRLLAPVSRHRGAAPQRIPQTLLRAPVSRFLVNS